MPEVIDTGTIDAQLKDTTPAAHDIVENLHEERARLRAASGFGNIVVRKGAIVTRRFRLLRAIWKRLFCCLFVPVTMWAHAVLVDSTLHDSEVVSTRTLAVILSFNSRVDQARSTLTLEGPGLPGTPVAVDKMPDRPSELSGQLSNLTSGSYKLHWQVLAVDGHITRGVISFSVR